MSSNGTIPHRTEPLSFTAALVRLQTMPGRAFFVHGLAPGVTIMAMNDEAARTVAAGLTTATSDPRAPEAVVAMWREACAQILLALGGVGVGGDPPPGGLVS